MEIDLYSLFKSTPALTDVTVIRIDLTELDYREANQVVYEQNGVTIHPVKASGRRQWTG